MTETRGISLIVNGQPRRATVDMRTTLVDFLREELRLTGTHVGCEHGVCGACTVLMDGEPIRACLLFAVQADGAELHPLQQAFHERHALQCGFCTPGFLLSAEALLRERPDPSEREVREALSGNLCRCTGYQGIVRSVRAADETWER